MSRSTLVILALLLIALGGYWLNKRFLTPVDDMPPVETVAAAVGNIEQTVTCLGEVQPARFTDIKSEVSARVLQVNVKSGVSVQKGDVLVELDRSELESQRKESQHMIEASRLRMERVKLDRDSKIELGEKGYVHQREVKEAQIEYDLALNSLSIEEAKQELLDRKLEKTTILAPHDGVVLQCRVLEGMVITGATSFSEGTVLMQVAELDVLEVETRVNEVDIPHIREGMEVNLTFESIPDLLLPARIDFVSPSADKPRSSPGQNQGGGGQGQQASEFPITVSFSSADPRVRPGMTAKVLVTLARVEGVVTTSLPAVFAEDGLHVVYVKNGEGFERREVAVGINDEMTVEILSGLQAGEMVATSRPRPAEGIPAAS